MTISYLQDLPDIAIIPTIPTIRVIRVIPDIPATRPHPMPAVILRTIITALQASQAAAAIQTTRPVIPATAARNAMYAEVRVHLPATVCTVSTETAISV